VDPVTRNPGQNRYMWNKKRLLIVAWVCDGGVRLLQQGKTCNWKIAALYISLSSSLRRKSRQCLVDRGYLAQEANKGPSMHTGRRLVWICVSANQLHQAGQLLDLQLFPTA
jgi:hypothetical protein